MNIEQQIEAEQAKIVAANRRLIELTQERAGYKEYTVSINVLEVYNIKARSEEEALEIYYDNMDAPERHIFEEPYVEER